MRQPRGCKGGQKAADGPPKEPNGATARGQGRGGREHAAEVGVDEEGAADAVEGDGEAAAGVLWVAGLRKGYV